jgi:hypothetical protein
MQGALTQCAQLPKVWHCACQAILQSPALNLLPAGSSLRWLCPLAAVGWRFCTGTFSFVICAHLVVSKYAGQWQALRLPVECSLPWQGMSPQAAHECMARHATSTQAKHPFNNVVHVPQRAGACTPGHIGVPEQCSCGEVDQLTRLPGTGRLCILSCLAATIPACQASPTMAGCLSITTTAQPKFACSASTKRHNLEPRNN